MGYIRIEADGEFADVPRAIIGIEDGIDLILFVICGSLWFTGPAALRHCVETVV